MTKSRLTATEIEADKNAQEAREAFAVQQVDIFELTGDTEIPKFLDWAEKVNPGVMFNIPSAGTVVIARNGRFEFFAPAWNAAGQGEGGTKAAKDPAYVDREKQHMRIQILTVAGGDLADAQAAEKWVFGESSD